MMNRQKLSQRIAAGILAALLVLPGAAWAQPTGIRGPAGFLVVLRQLRLRFGPLTPDIEERVRSTDADRLLEWSERVLTAETLQDVFRD